MNRTISSRDNPQFKMWKKLTTRKGIEEFGYFILSGKKLAREALDNSNLEIRAEILTEGLSPIFSTQPYVLPPQLFETLDILGTHFNLLVIKTPVFEPFKNSAPEGIEIIAPLGDPRNMGALIRSAVAFGVKKIILTTESCHPFLPQSIKASSLSSLVMKFEQAGPMSQLQGPLYALDLNGSEIDQTPLSKNMRLLIGQEGLGLKNVSPLTKLHRLSIRTQSVESLNATIAASIALYEISKQQRN